MFKGFSAPKKWCVSSPPGELMHVCAQIQHHWDLLQTSSAAVRNQNSQAVCSNSLPPLTKLSACVPSSAFSSIIYGCRIDNLQRQLLWNLGPISLSPSQRLKWGGRHVWKDDVKTDRQTDQGTKCKHTWTALYSSKKNLWSACPSEIFYPTDSLQLGSWVGQDTLRTRFIPMLLAANSH